MKPHTRRAVACIIGSVASGTPLSSVYDYSESKHFNFSGDVTLHHVRVYDYEQQCHINGSGDSGAFSFTITATRSMSASRFRATPFKAMITTLETI
jgi:hypothetical protein